MIVSDCCQVKVKYTSICSSCLEHCEPYEDEGSDLKENYTKVIKKTKKGKVSK